MITQPRDVGQLSAQQIRDTERQLRERFNEFFRICDGCGTRGVMGECPFCLGLYCQKDIAREKHGCAEKYDRRLRQEVAEYLEKHCSQHGGKWDPYCSTCEALKLAADEVQLPEADRPDSGAPTRGELQEPAPYPDRPMLRPKTGRVE